MYDMGLWEKLYWPKKQAVNQPALSPYATFSESNPISTSFNGEVYEQELIRACIDKFATACSKLDPSYEGTSRTVERMIKTSPNELMTWPQFLYRCATITEATNTCAIIPAYAKDMQTVVGVYPLMYEYAEVVDYAGEPWVKFYTAPDGYSPRCTHAIELRNVCFITRFQFKSDIFGSNVSPRTTLDLMKAQEEAQKSAIKAGARVKWMGQVSSRMDEKELDKKRKRFISTNLTADNEGGILVYDQTFSSVEQVKNQSYVINAEEMERIQENVFSYFGTNKAIIQNDYEPNKWAAYYEGKVEPWAVNISEGMTQMLFTRTQRLHNRIEFSSSRLQYAAMAEKRNMIRDMVDRGLMTLNEGRKILQMNTVPGGDQFVIRGEYLMLSQIDMTERQHDSDYEHQLLEKPLYEDMSNDSEDDINTEA
jgi:HK97 family phage portal protein